MNDVSTHGRAYTSDPDYLAFWGAPREAIIYDWSIRAYRKVKLSQPKCPHDVVQPADSEALIRDEHTDLDGQPRAHDERDTMRMQTKTIALFDEVRDLLRQRPMDCHELADATDVTYHRMKNLLQNYPHEVVVLTRGAKGNLYGLPGHNYATTQAKPYTGSMQRIIDYLREHGPATVKEICDATGVWRQTFRAEVKNFPDALRIVETIKPARGGMPMHVWAVAQ